MRVHTLSLVFGRGSHPEETKGIFAKDFPGAMIQALDRGAAQNGFLVQMVAAQTLRAEESGSLLARKPEIDFLLRLAATSQISEAIARSGSKDGKPFLLVVASTRPLMKGGPVRGGRPLPSGPLTESELRRVEAAALLSARRA